ncbi:MULTISPECIES: helix-turn-helix transcriptional regulator [Yersinia]|uniref:helix-turn-helix transcriptional regulator n=1 Tax=Yersinia TaxID=629 RepID=UPI0005DFB5B6|nr:MULTISPECIES: helix-turn-helix transcriptional regulator [Yersinia]MCB5302210.1 helix-turn-helix transcriptional regulator [Yersinia bercovieri]QDW31898.1 helix-turn-helix transcriptional regulator [Yersinia sp. KBS0713]CFQ40784.1 LuxR family transcriptional regulator [Yersinia bercovieri]
MKEDISQTLNVLIRFWAQSSEPWGVKDNKSQFIYANKKYHQLLALPDGFSVEGRLDGELPASTSEFQTEFQAHDRKVELLKDRVTSLEIHTFGGKTYVQPWFFDKYPLIDEDGVSVGTIFHGRAVDNMALNHLSKIQIPTSLVFTPPSTLFSNREWEVLFYLLHAYPSTEIANRLYLSTRTVCNIIQSIYRKAGVSSKQQIIEYCDAKNINNYIPQSFFKHTGSFLFMPKKANVD